MAVALGNSGDPLVLAALEALLAKLPDSGGEGEEGDGEDGEGGSVQSGGGTERAHVVRRAAKRTFAKAKPAASAEALSGRSASHPGASHSEAEGAVVGHMAAANDGGHGRNDVRDGHDRHDRQQRPVVEADILSDALVVEHLQWARAHLRAGARISFEEP